MFIQPLGMNTCFVIFVMAEPTQLWLVREVINAIPTGA